MDEKVTLILEDRKNYIAKQQFKAELRKQEEFENYKKKIRKSILALSVVLGLIVYATICMTA